MKKITREFISITQTAVEDAIHLSDIKSRVIVIAAPVP